VVGAWLAWVAHSGHRLGIPTLKGSGHPSEGEATQPSIDALPKISDLGEGGQGPGGGSLTTQALSETQRQTTMTLKGSALKPAAYLLLAIGAIGQTSIVNTMCHLHTPIHLSVARILSGLVAGCILGLLVILVAQRVWPDLRARGSE